jgi:hypothetical protein
VWENSADREARAEMAWASLLGGMALSAPVGRSAISPPAQAACSPLHTARLRSRTAARHEN